MVAACPCRDTLGSIVLIGLGTHDGCIEGFDSYDIDGIERRRSVRIVRIDTRDYLGDIRFDLRQSQRTENAGPASAQQAGVRTMKHQKLHQLYAESAKIATGSVGKGELYALLPMF